MGGYLVMSDTRDVFGGTYFMESMRSSGYDTSYSLAEIIDNAVEANAKHIEIMCADKLDYSEKRNISKLEEIAILDDGDGMSEEDLWNSLLMGEGTRRKTKNIGKFGMGLPNSSISQCKQVTVYSWQDPNNVFSTYLDLDHPNHEGKIVAPKPKKTELPDKWMIHSKYIKTKSTKSGTLVIWSKLDRVQWSRASSLIKNSKQLIGRTYRKFISRDKLTIRLVDFNLDTNEIKIDENMLPNDPLYQTVPSSTPSPWNEKKMFKPDGDTLEESEIIQHDGKDYEVKIRYAYATMEARKTIDGKQAGSMPYGKHANTNLGISLIRADRELYLDRRLCQTYDPLERWWGVEVDFPVELDDVFGVTNNKQNAVNFSTMTRKIGAMNRNEIDDDDEDSDGKLYDIVKKINARIQNMRRSIKNTNQKKDKTKPNGEPILPWDDGDDDSETVTGQGEQLSDEEKEKIITEVLSRTDPENATKRAKEILEKKLKATWQSAELGGNEFFDVSLKSGTAIITLSTDHILYKYIGEIENSISKDIELNDAKDRLNKLRIAIISIIISWARLENFASNKEERDQLVSKRRQWGERLTKLIKSISDTN